MMKNISRAKNAQPKTKIDRFNTDKKCSVQILS